MLENFAATLQQAMAGTPVKHVVVASMGDLLGFPKGLIVNFVVRTVQKMVPAWSLPGHVRFNDGDRRRPVDDLRRQPTLGPDDVAVLQYTGGTTGIAKGATLLHHTIVANLLASEAWMQPGLKRKPLSGQITIVCALPLYHVFAFITCGLLGMRTGALNMLIPNPRDIPGTIKELAKYRINIFPAVNTLFNALANNADFAKLDFSGLVDLQRRRHGGAGGGRQEMARHHRLPDRRGLWPQRDLGRRHLQSDRFGGLYRHDRPAAAQRRDQDPRRCRQASCRSARPGEIAIKGPQVMSGYWQRPDETAQGHDAGRLLQVGRHRRDGCARLHQDRGSQEGHDHRLGLQGLPQRDRGGGGEPSGRAGMRRRRRAGREVRRGGDAVRGEEGPELTKEALAAYCAKEFTGYKRPKYIEFRDELPKTNVGKILRRELRDGMLKKAA